MFGLWKRKKTVVFDYKYSPVHDFETSTNDLYDAIEKDLAARELTGLEISRIEYAEGGWLSARRQYLRIRRERLVFDVCSAPFGREWFFSYRAAEIPFSLRNWEVLVILLSIGLLAVFYVSLFGWMFGSIILVASFLSLLILMRQTVAIGKYDVDAALLQIPVLGALYEALIRKDSYYREDTRRAYLDFVTAVIQEKMKEAAAAKGIELLAFRDATPPAHPAILAMIGDMLRLSR